MRFTKSVVTLSFLIHLVGCESLIIKPDDNMASSTGKVVSRTLLGVGTLGMSEVGIAQIKQEVEARALIVTSGSRTSSLKDAKPPYRFLVWGNDSIAVGHVTDLFQRLGDTVLSPGRVQALVTEQTGKWTYTAEDSNALLKLANQLGVDAVIFVEVSGASETRTHVYSTPGIVMPVGSMYLASAPTSQAVSQQLHHLRVRVQSVSTSDGSVRWNGTAAYDKPVGSPDAAIGYLTDAAVERALCPNNKEFRWVEPAPWVNGGCLSVK